MGKLSLSRTKPTDSTFLSGPSLFKPRSLLTLINVIFGPRWASAGVSSKGGKEGTLFKLFFPSPRPQIKSKPRSFSSKGGGRRGKEKMRR